MHILLELLYFTNYYLHHSIVSFAIDLVYLIT